MLPAGAFRAVHLESLACAESTSGQISCFLVPGTADDTSLAPTGNFESFDVGLSTLCALDAAGTVTCHETPGPMVLQSPPAGVQFSQVAVADGFACAIRKDDATIVCWGSSGSATACGAAPAAGQLEAPSGSFVQVSSFGWHSCAIHSDQTVACWGIGKATDDSNQVFCDDKINYGESVAPTGTFSQVSAGQLHSCGVRTDGTLACWGAGTKQGDCSNDIDACGQAVPPAGNDFVQVAAGYSHTCAMRADRSVVCWGSNTGGRSTPPADFP